MDSPHFTTEQVAEYLRRTPGAIRNLVLRRAIPFRKPAGRLLFIKEEIDLWIRNSEGLSLDELKNEN
jgi:excisionase family DNA binding protein